MRRGAIQLAMLVITSAGLPALLSAQARLTKPIVAPAGLSAPASLTATMTPYGVWLRWPAVANATAYNVTRTSYPGNPETLIAARAAADYAFEGNHCSVSDTAPSCVFFDNQFRTTATKLTISYRVYAVVKTTSGTVSSPPSQMASVIWNCPDCPRLP